MTHSKIHNVMLEQEFSLGQIKEKLVQPPQVGIGADTSVLFDAWGNRGLFGYKSITEKNSPTVRPVSFRADAWNPRRYREGLNLYRPGLEALGFTSINDLLAVGYVNNMRKFEGVFSLDLEEARKVMGGIQAYDIPPSFKEFLELFIRGKLPGINEDWLGQKGFAEKYGISQSWVSVAINATYPVRLSTIAKLVEGMDVSPNLQAEVIEKYSKDPDVSLSGSAKYLSSEAKVKRVRPFSLWLDELRSLDRLKLTQLGFNSAEEFLFARYLNSSERMVAVLDETEGLSANGDTISSMSPLFEAINIKSLADLDKVDLEECRMYLDAWAKRGLFGSRKTNTTIMAVIEPLPSRIEVIRREGGSGRRPDPDVAIRREEVFRLVKEGFGYNEIADKLGISTAKVSTDVLKLRKQGKEIKLQKRKTPIEVPPDLDNSTRRAFLQLLKINLESNPQEKPNLAQMAKVLGVSRQRLDQILEKALKREEIDAIDLAQEVKKRQDHYKLKVENRYRQKRQEVLDNQQTREALYEQVVNLRKLGLTPGQIEKRLSLKRGRAMHILGRKFEEDPSLRVRKTRRTKEEVEVFKSQVKSLRDQGLTDKQISKQLNVSSHEVVGVIKKMLDAGQVERKVSSYRRSLESERQQRRERVLGLKKQGLNGIDIAKLLGVTNSIIYSDLSSLEKSGRL